MNTRITLLIALILVAALAATAMAQPGQGRRAGRGHGHDGPEGGGSEMRLERMAAHLDLTEAQKTAIETVHEQARKDSAELRKQLARLQNERRGEMLADEPSESNLVDLIEKMGEVRTKMQVMRLKTRLAVRDQLTEDQRDQFMLMQKHGRHGGHDGGRRAGTRGQCDNGSAF